MRRLLPLVAALALAAPGARAAATPVVVFEGQGLGHGVGLPLDGAEAMVLADPDTDAGDILDRFYPGASRARREGIVRVLVAATDRPREGLTLRLPDGGAVRDGRTTAVAPSFPLNVSSGGRVRLTFERGFHRAEVEGDDGSALGASRNSVWIEPRAGGAVEVDGGEYPGPLELVVAAERAHLVAELDVEQYVRGVDPRPDGRPLPGPVLEAAVVAARTYALRAGAAEMRVGRFHLHADERAQVYVGREAPAEVVRAARHSEGEVLVQGGMPVPALVTANAAGVTADAADVFGRRAAGLDVLAGLEYETTRPARWRVLMNLSDVAARLGYDGDATGLAVGGAAPSGRPLTLVVTGSQGRREVAAPDFHEALALPSTWFTAEVERRSQAVPPREESPPFQQLPGPVLGAADEGGDGDGGASVPTFLVALVPLLVVATLVARRGRSRRNAPARHRSGSG